MLVLWLGCFMELLVLAQFGPPADLGPRTTLLPYPTLAAVIKHIRELMIQMDRNLDVQRAKISNGLSRRALQSKNLSVVPDDDAPNMRASYSSPNTSKEMTSTTEDFYQSIRKASQIMAATERTNFGNKIKLRMQGLVNKGAGYCVSALDGFITIILEKYTSFVILETSFTRAILRMSPEGTSSIFDSLLLSRIKLLTIWTILSNAESKKHFLRNLQDALQDIDVLDTDIKEILTDYETFFKFEEGEKLINTVADFYDISPEDETGVKKAIEDMLNAFLAPAERFRDTSELKDLRHRLNMAYQRRYPDFEDSALNSILNSVNKYKHQSVAKDSVLPRRKNAKINYEQFMNHLLSNHTKFMKEILEHFHKKDNHYITHEIRKNNVQMKRKDRHKQHKQHQTYTNERSRKEKPRSHTISSTVRKRSHSATSRTTTNSVHRKRHKKKTHHNSEKHRKHYSDPRRILKYNETEFGTTIYSTKSDEDQIIEKVDGDSNYSDAETILKTMLNNAFKNPNNTLITNSTDISN